MQKQIVKYDIKSKYPEEYSTVDKVGRKKTFNEEIFFRVELTASSVLIQSTSKIDLIAFQSVLVFCVFLQ